MQSSLHTANKPHPARNFAYTSYGKVIAVKPERHRVDVALLSGGIVRDALVLSNSAGSRHGFSYLGSIDLSEEAALDKKPIVSNVSGTAYDYDTTKPALPKEGEQSQVGRNTYAVVGFVQGVTDMPYIIGFDFPNTDEMGFSEQGLLIDRHESDIYKMIDKEGNYEVNFDDGTFLRVGSGTTKKDLVGKDFDGLWNPKTDSPAKTVHLEHSSGTTVTIQPDGTVAINVSKDQTLNVVGDRTETIGGSHDETITEDETKSIGGDRSLSVLGDAMENFSQNLDRMVLGNQTDVITGDHSYDAANFDGMVPGVINLSVGEMLINFTTLTATASTSINLAAPLVCLGAAPIEFAALGLSLKLWLDTHTHSNGNLGSPTGKAIQAPSPNPSTTVKISG